MYGKPEIKYRPEPFDQVVSIEVVQYYFSDGQKNPPQRCWGGDLFRKK